MVTSSASTDKNRSALSKVRETAAKPWGFRVEVPKKMTSSIFSPRRVLLEVSPSTQRMASLKLLLPLPLGPTTAVRPLLKRTTVLSGKDLKPCISNDFKNIQKSFLKRVFLKKFNFAESCRLLAQMSRPLFPAKFLPCQTIHWIVWQRTFCLRSDGLRPFEQVHA